MTAPSPQHDLITRAQAADPEALAAIYERYAPGIFRYIYYRVGDTELAYDLQSEVFLRMLEGIGRYEDRGWPIGAWLYSIAHARVVDTMRRGDRHPSTSLSAWDASTDGPEETIDRTLSHESLQRAVGRLCEGQRRVLLLRYTYGLSLEETARQMGRTVGSVKALQHRAQDRVAQILREEGEA